MNIFKFIKQRIIKIARLCKLHFHRIFKTGGGGGGAAGNPQANPLNPLMIRHCDFIASHKGIQ